MPDGLIVYAIVYNLCVYVHVHWVSARFAFRLRKASPTNKNNETKTNKAEQQCLPIISLC